MQHPLTFRAPPNVSRSPVLMQRRAYPEGAGLGLVPNGPYGEFRADVLFTYFRHVPPLEPCGARIGCFGLQKQQQIKYDGNEKVMDPPIVSCRTSFLLPYVLCCFATPQLFRAVRRTPNVSGTIFS